MSRLVADMEAEGLVERRSSTEDRRVVTVIATATGEQILHAGRRRRVATLVARLNGLPAVDLALLDRAAVLMEGLARAAAGQDGPTENERGR